MVQTDLHCLEPLSLTQVTEDLKAAPYSARKTLGTVDKFHHFVPFLSNQIYSDDNIQPPFILMVKSLWAAPYSILGGQDRSNGLTVSPAVAALQCDLPHFYDYPRISMTIKLS